jgi:hypothetical protein
MRRVGRRFLWRMQNVFANRGVRAVLLGFALILLAVALYPYEPGCVVCLFIPALSLFVYAASLFLMVGWLQASEPVPRPNQMRPHPDDPAIIQQYRQGQWVTIVQKHGRFAIQKYFPQAYGWVNIFDYRAPQKPPES